MPPFPARPRALLDLESLESRETPAFLSTASVVSGSDLGGPPVVQIENPGTGAVTTQLLAFDSTFYGGVRVAVGDVTGDGVPDLVCVVGPSGGPAVKVFDGSNGNVTASFFAYDSSYSNGLFVAVGDLTGDGVAEIVTGTDLGGGPNVKIFDGSGNQLSSFFAYEPGFTGGVRVAVGDVTGDGQAEIITSTGPGGGPAVRTFSLDNGLTNPVVTGSFYAYASNFINGIYVAIGDVDGDGVGDIITGSGAGGGPQVNVFTATGSISFYAYDPSFTGGVRVAAADLTGDGIAEIITGAGPGGGPQVNVYQFPSSTPISTSYGLNADQQVGVFVAGSGDALSIPSTPDSVIQYAYDQLADTIAANQAAMTAAGTTTVIVPVGTFPFYYPYFFNPWGFGNWWGFGGFGLGLGGLFGATYGADIYGYDVYSNFYDPGIYVDPGFYDPGFYDPGYYDPGYYDPGFYDPAYSDFAYADYGYSDFGYSDFGYSDFGYSDFGFSDFGGGFGDFGGGFF